MSWIEEYEHFGVDFDEVAWQATIGCDSDRYGLLAARTGPAFDLDACRSRRRAREAQLVANLPARVGVPTLLSSLSERGVRLAVVSSSPRRWIEGHLARIGALTMFEFLVGREDAQRAKPHPDLYMEALRLLKIQAHDAVAVEDSFNGVRAAVAAGLRCIALPNDVTKSHDFTAAICASTPADVLDLLR